MEVELSSHFLKKAKKLSIEEQTKLSNKVELFRLNPSDPRLKTHALTGKLKGLYSFSATFGKRVTYEIVENKALFVDVGSHDEVYR